MYAGGSAREKAAALRVEAAALREQAELRVQEAQHWDSGADGEARVGRELARLYPHGWVALHDRLVRPDTSKANLDHLAVGPGGVALIDSKNWTSGAWLYDGTLFRQGPTGPVRCTAELTHVLRDAAVVAERLERSVVPVLCLSGTRTGKVTTPLQVDGVHVVPVSQLSQFLRTLPVAVSGSDVAALAQRLDDGFPTACAAPPPMSNARATVPFRLHTRPDLDAPTRNRQLRRVPSRAVRAAMAIGGLVIFATVAPRVLPAIADKAGHALGAELTSSPPAAPFAAPCAAVTTAQVAHAVGRRVYRQRTSETDTCRWTYRHSSDAYQPPDVEIQSGWLVNFSADAAHGKVQRQHESGAEGILVPQLVAVPGSRQSAAATTQPLAVSVNVSGKMTRARAARAVLALARLTETHMPTGPGATVVAPVR